MFLSLFELPFGIRFLQVTICGIEGLILLIGALCVVIMVDHLLLHCGNWKGLLVVEFSF